MFTPTPSALSSSAINEYAEKIGTHHDIYDANGKADIESLFIKLGGVFRPKDETDYFVIEEPGKFSISLPSLISKRRQVFLIAQAVGFYFLHYRYPQISTYAKFSRGSTDYTVVVQANQFASALLMPSQHFIPKFEGFSGEKDWDWSLSDNFFVSPKAARLRAHIFGMSEAV